MASSLREVARRLATPLLRHLLLGVPGEGEVAQLLPPDLSPLVGRIGELLEGELLRERRGRELVCRLCGRRLEGRRGAYFHLVRVHGEEVVVVLESILREEARRLQGLG